MGDMHDFTWHKITFLVPQVSWTFYSSLCTEGISSFL